MEDATLLFIAIIVLFVIFCCTIAAFLYICGITKSVEVGAGAPPIGNVTLAYKFSTGPYYECGSLFAEALKVAPPNTLTMGIFYDDPKKIPPKKLRYAVGAILSEGGIKVEQDVIEKMTDAGFKIINLPKVAHCVRTEFPYLSFLSIYLAVWKVYPRLSEYIKEHALCAYPMLEIYTQDKIQYMAPLSQQEDFYVPEAKENIPEEYLEFGDKSCLDYTLLNASRGSADRSSRESSVSTCTTFSRSYVGSRFGDEDFSDEESDGDNSNMPAGNVQDDEVTSTVNVRASKACTNLLEEIETQENVSCKDDGTLLTDDEKSQMMSEGQSLAPSQDDDSMNLQDSGICSGRTSASPTQSPKVQDTPGNAGGNDDEDSSSSFEEIKMETVEKETPST